MPRRPAKLTQADIARAIRAAKEAGADEIVIDANGQIRISLYPNPPPPSPEESYDTAAPSLNGSCRPRQKLRKGTLVDLKGT